MRNTMTYALLLLAAVLAFSTGGCGGSEKDGESGKGKSGDDKSGKQAAADVKVEIKSWSDIQAWVKEQKGKVVVIDIWSTWCTPCKKEFPHFVEMHEAMKDQVTCASVSIDFDGLGKPEENEEEVMDFLKKTKSTMKNFLSSDESDAVLGKVDAGAPPVSLVYDKDGNLSKKFEGEVSKESFTYEGDVIPYVKELLKAGQ